MYSVISSARARFSMLSFTFCSCPERVWRTNQRWRMIGKVDGGRGPRRGARSDDAADQPGGEQVHDDGEAAEDHGGDHHEHGGTPEFIAAGPGALAEFLAGF